MKYKILVFGAAGMAGHTISLHMHEHRHDVTGYDMRPMNRCACKSIIGYVKNTNDLRTCPVDECA